MLPITVEEDLTGSNFNFYFLLSTLPSNILVMTQKGETKQFYCLLKGDGCLQKKKQKQKQKTHVCLFEL